LNAGADTDPQKSGEKNQIRKWIADQRFSLRPLLNKNHLKIMAKISNNPILKGLSGMLGDVVVYRETRGKMIMSNRPRKPSQPTEHQKNFKAKFLQAVQYAKGQMLDPVAKAEYATGINDKLISAYGVAVTDFLKSPKITGIDVNGYQGLAGDTIVIEALDDFKVTSVAVEIRSALDELLEEGQASQNPVNGLSWNYVATQPNSSLAGTKLIVRAMDKPRNVTTQELTLA
jgi:hypothetical protein